MNDWKFHCVILSVRENATVKEVRRAYRKLALELHPDKHNNSIRSKEDFQQLNESYRYVMAALAEGRRPAPAPRPGSGLRTPVVEYPPEPKISRPAPPPQNFAKIWIHAGAVCVALLLISVWLERSAHRGPGTEMGKRDLAVQAWCSISHSENGRDVRDLFELRPQQNCEEQCQGIARTRDVACSWSSTEFHALKKNSPRPVEAAQAQLSGTIEDAEIPCEISVEREAGQPLNVNYQHQDDKSCRQICAEKAKSFPRAGLRCAFGGAEFLKQARAVQQPEPQQEELIAEPPPPRRESSAKDIVKSSDSVDTGAPQADNDPNAFRATCFMSVLLPGDPWSQEFQNDTERLCENRCIREVTAHPLDRIVKCAFAGRELINHTPDPMSSYLARNPSQAGFQQGNTFVANCEIYGVYNGKRVQARAGLTSEEDCKDKCKYEFVMQQKHTEISCTYNGQGFFRGRVGE